MEFSEQWWDQFLNKSENLTKPAIINNAFSDDTSKRILEESMGLFKKFDENALFRIWINGVQRDDFNQVLMENPPIENDTLKSWTNRIFGQQRFGIIFNECERWNKSLNVEIYNKIKPLLEKAGYPMMGVDINIFIGNYGWTPLGIHIDHIGESVMHFHLGPGTKEMYLWDKEEYMNDMGGKLGESRPEFYTKKATKYTIETNGVFFMPWGMPHIGKADELSVGVSVWLNKPTKTRIIGKLTSNLQSEYMTEGKSFTNEHDEYVDNSQNVETIDYKNDPLTDLFPELISEVKKIDLLNSFSFLDLLKMEIQDYQYSLKSNLNFSYPLTHDKAKGTMKISKQNLISIDYPYKIEFYHSNISNKLHLFIKGQKLMLNYSQEIVELIKRLNKYETIKIADLQKDIFTNIPEEVFIRIIEILYENHGLLIKNAIEKYKIEENVITH